MDEATLDELANDPEALAEVLLYHVVEGKVMSTDLTDGPVPTLSGDDVSITITFEAVGEGEEGIVKVNGATVVIPNVEGSNVSLFCRVLS